MGQREQELPGLSITRRMEVLVDGFAEQKMQMNWDLYVWCVLGYCLGKFEEDWIGIVLSGCSFPHLVTYFFDKYN